MTGIQLIKALSNPTYKSIVHSLSVGYFLLLTFGVLYACIVIAYPVVYQDSWTFKKNTIFLLYMFLNIMGNFALGILYSSDFKSGIILLDPPRSWHFCSICNQHSPPRSHHCSICNRCIMKRDHHCFFLCQCVGLRNQKYFIIFSLYVSMGSFYAIKVILSYLHVTYVPLQMNFYCMLSYMFPGFLYNWIWTNIDITMSTIICTVVLYGTFSTALGCAFLFFTQCFLVCKGQTPHEIMKNIHVYRGTIFRNFTLVFGSWWFINFFLPIPTISKEEKAPWGFPSYYKDV